jgi:hypothetical protein
VIAVSASDDDGSASEVRCQFDTTLGHPIWTVPLPTGATALRVGTTPDLNGDGWQEARVAFVQPQRIGLTTWILSGADGDLMFRVDGRAPFDPWMEDNAAGNAWRLAEELLADAEWSHGLHQRPWSASFGSPLPTNVSTAGRANDTSFAPRDVTRREDDGGRVRPTGQPGPVTLRIKRVNFGNSNIITRDYDTGHGGATYTPRWFDNNNDGDAADWSAGDERAPICYTVPNRVRVTSVVFNVDPPGAIDLANAQVIGSANGFDDFFSTGPLTYNAAETRISATIAASTTSTFWTTIAHVPDYPITWRIFDGTTNHPGGTSRNHMYWVLQPPGSGFTFYYSLVHIGCSEAHGFDGSSHVAIADAIFDAFDNRTVYRATDQLEEVLPLNALDYFGDWDSSALTFPELLTTGDAQCGAWSEFFTRCLHAVGIDPLHEVSQVNYDRIPNVWGAGAYMLAFDWNMPGAGGHVPPAWDAEYDYLNIWAAPPIVGNSYNWLFADVTDATGVPSQGPTPNPHSYFPVHLIVNVGTRYYDPSFGQVYNSFTEFENGAFEAFALDFYTGGLAVNEWLVMLDLNGNGLTEDLEVLVPGVVIKPNDPNASDLRHIKWDLSR